MTVWKKTFSIIWLGQAFSLLTSAIIQFAIVWWITEKTGSARVLAFASIAAILPQALLGMFIGVWVDRGNRKQIMVLSDCFVAMCSAILGIIYYFDAIELWHIYLLLALRSVGSSFQFPAMQASVPLLAPENQYTRIAGINQLLQSSSNILGPALGALFVSLIPMGGIMLIDVAGAAVAVITLLSVKIPQPNVTQESAHSVFHDIQFALKTIYHNRGLFYMMLAWIFCIFMYMPINALFPLITYEHFNGSAIEMGIVESALGVGALSGALIIGICNVPRKSIVIHMAYIIMGASLFVSGLLPAHDFTYFVLLIIGIGLSYPFFNSSIMATIQTHVDPTLLGRIFSVFGSLCVLPIPLGLLATGFLAESIGLSASFLISGSAILLTGIVCCFIPAIAKLDKR